jgi:hypothetical protein
MDILICGGFVIFIIIFFLAINKIRIYCPYCKTKTVYCTGVDRPEPPRTVVWVCEKCNREIY